MSGCPFTPLVRVVRTTITATEAGKQLIDGLSCRFLYLSREGWQKQIAAGNVLLNSQCMDAAHVLTAGDQLEFIPRGLEEKAVCWDIEILYEDARFVVVNKPGNLPCHPAGSFFNHTLWAWLKQMHHMDDVYFVNRIDRETSGVVLIARKSEDVSLATKLLLEESSTKEYLVLVEGIVSEKYFVAKGWLAQDHQSEIRKKRRFYYEREHIPLGDKAESCKTEFFKVKESADLSITLLKARLHTGRMHQIRATLFSLGYPVVGDKLYGVDDQLFLKFIHSELTEEDGRRLRLLRQALHAYRLKLKLPNEGKEEFIAPYPVELQELLDY